MRSNDTQQLATTGYSDRGAGDALWVSKYGAAARLGLSPRTLDRWRAEGTGPPWARLGGSARYRIGDLDAWAESQREPTNPHKNANTSR